MVNLIVVKDENNISDLLDHLHDRFYCISEIEYISKEQCLKIFTTVTNNKPTIVKRGIIKKKWQFDVYKAILTIHNVISYSIKDKARIDESDINTISFDHGFIKIVGSVPVTLEIEVSSINIELKKQNKPFKTELRTSYGILPLETSK